MKWLVFCLLLSGCISPQVTVYKIVAIKGNKEPVTVHYQANSTTGVDAKVDPSFKDLIKIPVVP
jgi:uncharacterized iron-regulated protein